MDILSQILSENYTKSAAVRVLSEMEDEARKKPSKEVEKKFAEAKKELEAIEPLHMYLPMELPEADIKKIVEKLRKEYGKNFLIEIKFKGELIGGCALSYKGVYKDYSIKNKIKCAISNGQFAINA